MATHEEILAGIFYKPETQDWHEPVLMAMDKAVDQALAWVPVDRNNLPEGDFLVKNKSGEFAFGRMMLWGDDVECNSNNVMIEEHLLYYVTHYFNPANLKMPQS